MLSKIDECETGSEVAKSVNVLIAIRWIAQAWDCVREETIRKCFRKAGIVSDDGHVISKNEEDPFADLDKENDGENHDECQEMQALVNQVMSNGEKCSADEYINGDNDLDFCFDLSNDNWENEFLTMLVSDQEIRCDDTNQNKSEGESDDNDIVPPEPKIKTIRSAIQLLEEVQYFLQYHGYTCPSSLSSPIDTLADIQSKKLIQTSIDDYLSC